jgi:hypothetical protein
VTRLEVNQSIQNRLGLPTESAASTRGPPKYNTTTRQRCCGAGRRQGAGPIVTIIIYPYNDCHVKKVYTRSDPHIKPIISSSPQCLANFVSLGRCQLVGEDDVPADDEVAHFFHRGSFGNREAFACDSGFLVGFDDLRGLSEYVEDGRLVATYSSRQHNLDLSPIQMIYRSV